MKRCTILLYIHLSTLPLRIQCKDMNVLDSRWEFRQVWKKIWLRTLPCQLIWWSKKKNLTKYLDLDIM